MRNRKFLIVLLLVFVAIGWFVAKRQVVLQPSARGGQRIFEPQTSIEGEVEVTVRPKNVSRDTSVWGFEITMDSHTVDLKEDLTQLSFLLDEEGNVYKPLSWEGDPPGGHHRSGTLVFGPIKPIPKSIELIINEAGGVFFRSFKWEL